MEPRALAIWLRSLGKDWCSQFAWRIELPDVAAANAPETQGNIRKEEPGKLQAKENQRKTKGSTPTFSWSLVFFCRLYIDWRST